jgi:serine/threonine protein kinase
LRPPDATPERPLRSDLKPDRKNGVILPIAAKIASGGMGIVYRAKDLRLQRYVALKFISGDNLTTETRYESIRREARAGSV